MLLASLSDATLRAVYTAVAPVHDGLVWPIESKARQRGLREANVRDGETVLELGVGTGLGFQHLLRQNPHGWTEGVDLTPAMLRRARRRVARAFTDRYRLRQGDVRSLRYEENTFDLVFSSYLFDLLSVEDVSEILGELRRVLKPGGQIVLVSMTEGQRWWERGWELLYRIHPALMGGCRGVRMAPHLRKAGFQQVRRQYVSRRTFPSEVVCGFNV